MTTDLKHAVHALIADHGHAAPLLELVSHFNWQARYAPAADAARIARAAKLLAEAYDLVAAVEAEEALS